MFASEAESGSVESLARRLGPQSLRAIARRPDRRWLVLLALVGWPPIGTSIGTLISNATGCARFAATCTEPLSIVPLLVQPLVIGALVAVPAAAAVAAFATVVALVVATAATAVLALASMPGSGEARFVLVAVVGVAWFVAVIAGIVRVRSGREPGG
jgi:hypothetical protein